jgi:serine/threonine protein kinase
MNAWSVPGYREERVLGSGGSGRVVLATYSETDAHVAIKYLSDELRSDPRFRIAFRDEARRMVEIGDPNIVRFYEYVESSLGAAIVMELVDGVPLRKILHEHGATSPEAALVILKGSLLGLSTAHSAGIVHRDYKPENVLVQADGFSKLTDFGIAAADGDPGIPVGTPPYMAPEQWNGAPATPATDVYAATCVFFECLTGRKPYRADHPATLRHLHQSAAIPVEAVPRSVRNLVTRGLAKNPADRPSTARAFVGELETAALGAYGPEWEHRGRRHLAELAHLLALSFPLAEGAPQTSTSLARTTLNRPLRYGPRVLIAAGVLTVGVVVAVLAANRHNTPVRDVSLATSPKPTAHAAVQPPTDTPPKSSPTSQASAPQKTPQGTPTTTPTPGPTPTRTPTALKVSDLTIAGFDGRTATVRVRTSTPQNVTLTARFAEGTSPSKLIAGRPKTFVLTGSTSYNRSIDAGFAAPSCGETVYRQVTVSTTTKAAGRAANGPQAKEVKVSGPNCAPPTVSIASWDGSTLSVRVRNATPDPVTLTAAFHQTVTVGERNVERSSNRQAKLSGDSVYDREFSLRFTTPECGYVDVRNVVVNVSSALGTASDSARTVHKGDACAEPTPQQTPEPAPQPTKEEHTGTPTRGPVGEPHDKPSARSNDKPSAKPSAKSGDEPGAGFGDNSSARQNGKSSGTPVRRPPRDGTTGPRTRAARTGGATEPTPAG